MKQARKRWDLASVMFATGCSREMAESAEAMVADSDRAKRLAKQQCPPCFYLRHRIGGAAMTSKPCGVCGEEMMFGSTATGQVCMACAKDLDLCEYCGGTIDLRDRRKAHEVK